MNTVGPIALIGGREHRDVAEPIDRWLLDNVGHDRVRVTVVPAASGAHSLPPTAALARNYWTALGAQVSIALPDRDSWERSLAALEDPDIVVLTGGVPDRVIGSLAASPVWDRILDLWRSGVALSGSSAGSMSLFEWRLRLTPPHPFALIPGLGPLSGYVSVPHFDRYVGARRGRRRLVERVVAGFGGLGLLGLDEGTGIVGWDGRYTVLGAGGVTILDADGWQTYSVGGVVPLRLQRTQRLQRPPRLGVLRPGAEASADLALAAGG